MSVSVSEGGKRDGEAVVAIAAEQKRQEDADGPSELEAKGSGGGGRLGASVGEGDGGGGGGEVVESTDLEGVAALRPLKDDPLKLGDHSAPSPRPSNGPFKVRFGNVEENELEGIQPRLKPRPQAMQPNIADTANVAVGGKVEVHHLAALHAELNGAHGSVERVFDDGNFGVRLTDGQVLKLKPRNVRARAVTDYYESAEDALKAAAPDAPQVTQS